MSTTGGKDLQKIRLAELLQNINWYPQQIKQKTTTMKNLKTKKMKLDSIKKFIEQITMNKNKNVKVQTRKQWFKKNILRRKTLHYTALTFGSTCERLQQTCNLDCSSSCWYCLEQAAWPGKMTGIQRACDWWCPSAPQLAETCWSSNLLGACCWNSRLWGSWKHHEACLCTAWVQQYGMPAPGPM